MREGAEEDSQGSLFDAGSDVGPVGHRAEGVGGITRDAHGEAGEGGDAGVGVIGGEERVSGVPDRVDGSRVVDANCRPVPQLDAAVEAHAIDVARGTIQQRLRNGDLGSDADPVDDVPYDLAVVSAIGTAAGEVLEGNEGGRKGDLEVLWHRD